MSITLMAAVWPLAIDATDKLVLLALADRADDDGQCFPGIASLVAKCSLSERTVQTAIKRLVEAGHLTIEREPGGGRRTRTYRVHPAAAAPRSKCAPQMEAESPAAAAPNTSGYINTPHPQARARRANEGTYLPSDWEPAELTSVAAAIVARWRPGELEEQLAKFRAHWKASAEPGALKRDWQAAWEKWIISRDEDRKQSDDTGVGRRATERMGRNHGAHRAGAAANAGGELSVMVATAAARRAARQAGHG